MSMKLPFLIAAFVMVFAVSGTQAEAQRTQRVDWSQYIDKDAKTSTPKQEAAQPAKKGTRARPAKRAAASKAAAKPRAKKATKRRK